MKNIMKKKTISHLDMKRVRGGAGATDQGDSFTENLGEFVEGGTKTVFAFRTILPYCGPSAPEIASLLFCAGGFINAYVN